MRLLYAVRVHQYRPYDRYDLFFYRINSENGFDNLPTNIVIVVADCMK